MVVVVARAHRLVLARLVVAVVALQAKVLKVLVQQQSQEAIPMLLRPMSIWEEVKEGAAFRVMPSARRLTTVAVVGQAVMARAQPMAALVTHLSMAGAAEPVAQVLRMWVLNKEVPLEVLLDLILDRRVPQRVLAHPVELAVAKVAMLVVLAWTPPMALLLRAAVAVVVVAMLPVSAARVAMVAIRLAARVAARQVLRKVARAAMGPTVASSSELSLKELSCQQITSLMARQQTAS